MDVAVKAYNQYEQLEEEDSLEDDDDDDQINPRDVGHNIYILAHQLAQHNKELAALLKNPDPPNPALTYYAKHTGQIEIVRHDRTLEQIVFPIPEICEYLTAETKVKLYQTAERDDQGSKVTDFFERHTSLFDEMKWQKKLRSNPVLFWVSSHMRLWSGISFNLAILCNLIVALFYPFSSGPGTLDRRLSGLIWMAMIVSLVVVVSTSKTIGYRTLVASVILRLIFSIGLSTTLLLIGSLHILNSTIFMIALMGNSGTFTKSLRDILTDFEFVYHIVYIIISLLGTFFHPFFFSLLLLDVVYREETLVNVIRSVTKNGRSILLTAVLAVILIYLFSIIGFIFFQDDFLMEVSPLEPIVNTDLVKNAAKLATNLGQTGTCSSEKDCNGTSTDASVYGEDDGEVRERHCDSLIMCIVTTLNEGLRNGGGIGDTLRKPSQRVSFLFNHD